MGSNGGNGSWKLKFVKPCDDWEVGLVMKWQNFN